MSLKSILFIVLVFAFGTLRAQSRPNIDTVSLYNLVPGLMLSDIGPRVNAPMDTLVWNKDTTGIIKFVRPYQGIHGEYRLAIQKGKLTQIIFTAPVKDPKETKDMYDRLVSLCKEIYGEPDINYYNVYREVRWDGIKRSIGVKTQDGTTYVSLVLQEYQGKRQ
jgi:hypothetical protein